MFKIYNSSKRKKNCGLKLTNYILKIVYLINILKFLRFLKILKEFLCTKKYNINLFSKSLLRRGVNNKREEWRGILKVKIV